ncbi:MAG: ABC transporter ATP-binding protein [Methanoregula sp.]|nr:ABC transporter ATP-binding protein [Methanoregula sp.]
MLEISHLNISHDHLQVVWDLSLSVKEGEIVTLIGPNGSGKTTTVETIAGLNKKASGSVRFLGKEILGMPPHQIFKEGLALVPERREIFSKMSVGENLQLGIAGKENARDRMLDLVYSLFPVLHEREKQQAGTMSGGEQQMLAIARALMSDPKLLVLDEPSTGLSPLLVAQVFRSLEQLGRGGLTILLLEQNVRNALDLCNRGYVLENGRIVLEGKAKDLMHHPHIQKAYLGF